MMCERSPTRAVRRRPGIRFTVFRAVTSGLADRALTSPDGPSGLAPVSIFDEGLLLQVRLPVQHDREGLRRSPFRRNREQEPVAVARWVALPAVRECEQTLGNAGLKRSWRNGHGHHLPPRREIEKLFAVGPPVRIVASASGNLYFGSCQVSRCGRR